jgi:23S rRNA (guanosine2251-2'-O)-methyltransferase
MQRFFAVGAVIDRPEEGGLMSTEWRDQVKAFDDAPYAYEYATLFDLITLARGKKDALIVALDHITDVGNLGAIIRSAEVVGACGVVIPNKRAAQVNEAVYRTSAGAVEYLKIAREPNLANAIRRLKEEGFWAAGATEHARDDIWKAPLEGRLLLVVGAEDTGLSRLTRDLCDFEVKLPQRGFTQSLNVASAFTAIAYEWVRRTSCTP